MIILFGYADLGFEVELNTTNNYPDYYLDEEYLFDEWKLNQEILRDNGI